MFRSLPDRPSWRYLQVEAKRLLKAHAARDHTVCDVLRSARRFASDTDQAILDADVSLAEIQLSLARSYGFKTWHQLRVHVDSRSARSEFARYAEHGYDKVAVEYSRLEHGSAWPRMRWLQKVLALLEPGSSVLDLGCGSGDPADIEIARHHSVVGVDVSSTQVALARRNVPRGIFIHADIESVLLERQSFDAVVMFYTIEHVSRTRHASLLARIRGWTRSGGYLLFTCEAADYDDVHGRWLDVPMTLSCFDPEKTIEIAREVGLEIVEAAIEKQLEGETEIRNRLLSPTYRGEAGTEIIGGHEAEQSEDLAGTHPGVDPQRAEPATVLRGTRDPIVHVPVVAHTFDGGAWQ